MHSPWAEPRNPQVGMPNCVHRRSLREHMHITALEKAPACNATGPFLVLYPQTWPPPPPITSPGQFSRLEVSRSVGMHSRGIRSIWNLTWILQTSPSQANTPLSEIMWRGDILRTVSEDRQLWTLSVPVCPGDRRGQLSLRARPCEWPLLWEANHARPWDLAQTRKPSQLSWG